MVGRRPRGLAHVLVGDRDGAVPDERRSAGQQLVEQAAGRVDVGPRVDGLAAGLLGGEVLRGPDDGRGLGHGVRVAHRASDAEVHHLDVAARGEHDVPRFDVAVDDAGAVAVVERGQHTAGDLERTLGQDLAALAQDVAQGASGHELHDDVGLHRLTAVGGRLLAGVVDGDDGRVVERGRALRLAAEPGLERRVAGQVGAEPLDRDHAAQAAVVSLAHLGHAAPAEQLAELVATTDQHPAGGRLRGRRPWAARRPGRWAGPAARTAVGVVRWVCLSLESSRSGRRRAPGRRHRRRARAGLRGLVPGRAGGR